MRNRHAKDKSTATDFCRSFPWTKDITWFDGKGVVKLASRRATICLREIGESVGNFREFRVCIIAASGETVDATNFAFDAYLSERADTRDDYDGGFKVVSHCGFEFYIAKPKDTAPIVQAIEKYMDLFWPEDVR